MLHRHVYCMVAFGSLFLYLCSLARLDANYGDPVSVNSVRFSREKITEGRNYWLEIEVEIMGGSNSSPDALNERYVDDILVTLGLGYSLESGESKRFRFFNAQARIPTLEENVRRSIFFYLPPEVVERDNLRAEPFAYLVELSVKGQALPTRRENVSTNLKNASLVDSFRERLASLAVENEGVLLPIYHTPFQQISRKMQVSPAYVRKPDE